MKHSAEIYGCLNSNYLPLEEFLIIFFLKREKLRRLAEIKLIEFLCSLKYYIAIWPRAKTFAQLCGLLRIGETMETDVNKYTSDIFLQDFFLTAYKVIHLNSEGLINNLEGISNLF